MALAWLAGSAASVVPDDAAPLSFLSGATVVVMSGLPGDVESETAFEADLHRLLEVFARPTARPRELQLLVDAPERVSLPAGLVGRAQAGTRANLLSLAPGLAGDASPLVVLVWGHGGVQGSLPVFHVRGPRITAEDLVTFASRTGSHRSSWVLSFRGSGAFARALRGPGRAVLASEDDVVFNSDPVGFGLLVRLLRDQPALGFEEAAARTARATAAWYEEQRLARTEEPTLSTGNGPARRLVAAAVSVENVAATNAPPSAPAEPPRPVPTSPPSESAPSEQAGWAGIAPVPPEKYPGAPAVVLRRRTSHTIGDSPALAEEVDEFIQVMSVEGERYGDVLLSYSPPEEAVTLLDAEVRHADGRIERLDPEAARDARMPAVEDYGAAARKAFSFAGVAPGVVLRVHYRRQWQHFPLPHVILDVPLAAEVPIVESEVAVRLSAGSAFHHAFAGLTPVAPTVERGTYGVTYGWRFRDVAPEPLEALTPPNRTPRLFVSTFPDWTSFAAWYRRLIQEADRVTPEIEAKAREVTRDAKGERAKVVALYNYVAALRYVAIPLGVNSHRPHAAARVLQNRYGDCKDKANLFDTLLRTLGITADLVLAPRFGEAFDDVPGVGFNHALSRVRIGEEVVWADTTDELARFGLLPPGDPGRKVLVVDGVANGLVSLPAPGAAAHRLSLRAHLRADAGSWIGTLEASGSGLVDYALRQAAREAAAQIGSRPVLGELFRPASGAFEIARQSHTPPAALEDAFAWSAEGGFRGLESSLPDDRRVVRAPFWLPREWDLALPARRSPLFLNQGYPLALHEEIEMALPADASEVALPPVREESTSPLRFRAEWTRAGPRTLVASLDVELAKGELEVAETPIFQGQLRALVEAVAQGAVYESGRTARPAR